MKVKENRSARQERAPTLSPSPKSARSRRALHDYLTIAERGALTYDDGTCA